MAGLKDYTAEELDCELLELFATHQKISASNIPSADIFLDALRSRVDKIETLEMEADAILMARQMDIDMAEAIMRVEKGSSVSSMRA